MASIITPATVVSGLTALAHESRLRLFTLLVRKGHTGASAGELARELELPPQTFSFHAKEMTRAGLLRQWRRGRNVYYAVEFDHVRQLASYLLDACCIDDQPQGDSDD